MIVIKSAANPGRFVIFITCREIDVHARDYSEGNILSLNANGIFD